MERADHPEPEDPVTLRNTQRRPLLFRIAGETVRLSPGESRKVDRQWLAGPEVQHFQASGALFVVDPRPADDAEPAAGAEGDDGDDGDEDDESDVADAGAERGARATSRRRGPTTKGGSA